MLKRLERNDGLLSAHTKILDALRRALEIEGVIFIPENGGLSGARLRRDPPPSIRARAPRGREREPFTQEHLRLLVARFKDNHLPQLSEDKPSRAVTLDDDLVLRRDGRAIGSLAFEAGQLKYEPFIKLSRMATELDLRRWVQQARGHKSLSDDAPGVRLQKES